MISDGAFYSVAWGKPGEVYALHVHVPTPDEETLGAIAYLEERML